MWIVFLPSLTYKCFNLMFLPLALWHPHNLILKNTLHLVLLSASFQKLKFLSLEANNIMKNNCELCYTFSTSGMREYHMQRDFSLRIFMRINIGVRLVLGFNVTFYWMRIREFFSEAVFFLLGIHSRRKIYSIISTNGFTLKVICISVCHSAHY